MDVQSYFMNKEIPHDVLQLNESLINKVKEIEEASLKNVDDYFNGSIDETTIQSQSIEEIKENALSNFLFYINYNNLDHVNIRVYGPIGLFVYSNYFLNRNSINFIK